MQPLLAESNAGASVQGRHIFFNGEKQNGEALTANVGGASIPIPATALPCAGCHGRDGKGRAEGGVIPSNIVWDNLARSYGGTSASGRKFKAYDVSSFLRAVTEGIDSSGNALDSSMPRFNISRKDARDLVAYLKVIKDDFDPGVSDDEIVIGTLQPTQEYQKRAASALISVINAKFDEVNQQGGLYGRHLKLKVVGFDDRQSFIGSASQLIAADKVFALLGTFSASADQSLTDMAEEGEIPSIAPYTQFPTAEGGRHQYTFYLHGGLDAQVAVLAKRIAARAAKSAKTFVMYQNEGRFVENAKKAITLLEQNDSGNNELLAYDLAGEKAFDKLIEMDSNPGSSVLFLGSSSDLVSMLGKTADKENVPQLYLPGFFVTSHILNLPKKYADQLEMTYINVPGGGEDDSLKDFRDFMSRNKLHYDFLTIRLFAYSAVNTLVEGIKRSGKRVSRKKVVDAIEQLYNFNAGMNRPISFGSRRRTGVQGAYVVKLDAGNKRLQPSGTWVRLD